MSYARILDRKNVALACLCGAGCVVLVVALLLEHATIAALAKLAASSAFVLLAASAGAPGSRYGSIVLAGLVLSWFGDAFLVGTTKRWFLLGLASFLLAHIAYVTAFVTAGVERRWTVGASVPIVIIAAGVLLWLQPYLPPDLLWPVRFYTAVISLMVITAFGTLGAGATPLIVSGACLFYLSDLSVAALRFTESAFPTYVVGLPLYYAAQICLALSIAASSNRDPSKARH
ncbi:MAG TPA: lysoplasmalogenase [Woeseiaceae bacterium]|nr:lysoplasmalogenase [Woeseiaceae bacterium]